MNSTIKHLIIAVVVVLNSNGIFAQTDNNSANLVMHIFTSVGSNDVNMSVGPGVATASLTGLQAGNVTFNGSVVALESSMVYEDI